MFNVKLRATKLQKISITPAKCRFFSSKNTKYRWFEKIKIEYLMSLQAKSSIVKNYEYAFHFSAFAGVCKADDR